MRTWVLVGMEEQDGETGDWMHYAEVMPRIKALEAENAKLRALVERGKRVLRMNYGDGKAYQFDCEEALK